MFAVPGTLVLSKYFIYTYVLFVRISDKRVTEHFDHEDTHDDCNQTEIKWLFIKERYKKNHNPIDVGYIIVLRILITVK